MPGSPDLCDRIGRIFSETIHVDVPSPDIDLFEAGLLDSLAFVELLLQLELEFGVTTSLEDLDAAHFGSIARIAEFVSSRVTVRPRLVPLRARA